MKLLIAILLWFLLFSLSPILAIVALILYPIVWALLLPLRLVGICADSVLLFIRVVDMCAPRGDRAIQTANNLTPGRVEYAGSGRARPTLSVGTGGREPCGERSRFVRC